METSGTGGITGDEGDDRSAREAALGRLAASLWHETLNLLSVLGFWTKVQVQAPVPDAAPITPSLLNDACTRVAATLERLTLIAKAQHLCAAGALRGARAAYDLRATAKLALELAAPRLRVAGISFATEAPEQPLTIEGSQGEGVLALALMLGRVAATAVGSAPEVRLVVRSSSAGGSIDVCGSAVRSGDLGALADEGDPELALVGRLAAGAGINITIEGLRLATAADVADRPFAMDGVPLTPGHAATWTE